MGFSGKPSSGCGTCRKRKIKCDEGRPQCGQCIRSKRECLGYRDLSTLIFKNKTAAQASSTQESDPQPGPSQFRELSPDEPTGNEGVVVPWSMQESVEHQALCFFLDQYVIMPRRLATGRCFLDNLVPIYVESNFNKPLLSAVSAVSMLSLSRQPGRKKLENQASILYGRAMLMLSRAVADPQESREDGTLLTTMLLSLYNIIGATDETAMSWGHHIDGANALLKVEGRNNRASPYSEKLYWAANNQSIITNVLRKRPCPPFTDFMSIWEPETPEVPPNNPASKMCSLGLRLPLLRKEADKLLDEQLMSPLLVREILRLLASTRLVDQELHGWAYEVPTQWRPRTVAIYRPALIDLDGEPLADDNYWPGPVYSYYSLFVASVWGNYRTWRILCQGIILGCLERLFPEDQLINMPEYQAAVATIRRMEDELCSSVPFLLGRVNYAQVDGPERPLSPPPVLEQTLQGRDTLSSLDDNCEPMMRPPAYWDEPNEPKALGSVYTMFNLFVASSVHKVPKAQRQWLIARLGEASKSFGIGTADVLHRLGQNELRLGHYYMEYKIRDYEPRLPLRDLMVAETGLEESPLSSRGYGGSKGATVLRWLQDFVSRYE